MSEHPEYPVPARFSDAHITPDRYAEWYRESMEDPAAFWAARADEFLQWESPWHTVTHSNLATGEAQWFAGGKLNVSVN